jgi:mannosyltransferase OCH1-like enzyme
MARIFYSILIIFILIIIIYIYKSDDNINKPIELYNVPHYIERKSKDAPTIVSGVPLVIYQSWHSNTVPEKMKDNIYKLIDKNPEFDYYLYSDEKCREFIANNFTTDVVNAFDMLRPGAYKSDLWRYCILYKNGGVYLDIKFFSYVPFINLIRTNPVIFVKDIGAECIYNAFMVSTPQNEIFKYCIDSILNSCKFKLYKNGSLNITGPCLLGKIILENNGKEYIKKIKFKHTVYGFTQKQILYNNKLILQSYKEYNLDQQLNEKTEHYSILWNKRQVYKNATTF